MSGIEMREVHAAEYREEGADLQACPSEPRRTPDCRCDSTDSMWIFRYRNLGIVERSHMIEDASVRIHEVEDGTGASSWCGVRFQRPKFFRRTRYSVDLSSTLGLDAARRDVPKIFAEESANEQALDEEDTSVVLLRAWYLPDDTVF